MAENDRSVSLIPSNLRGCDHASRLDGTLRALNLVLERLAAANEGDVDPRKHFYETFGREANVYEKDFHKKYHDDLNTILVFVS
jgi:hypothetical protein